jgi:hypothetical protein
MFCVSRSRRKCEVEVWSALDLLRIETVDGASLELESCASWHASSPPADSLHRCEVRRREEGGAAVGLTRKGKGTKILATADSAGLSLAVTIASANPAETALVDATLETRFLRREIIGDNGDDSISRMRGW